MNTLTKVVLVAKRRRTDVGETTQGSLRNQFSSVQSLSRVRLFTTP